MSQEIEIIKQITTFISLLQYSHFLFSHLAIIHLILIATFKVDSYHTGWISCQIALQNVLRNIKEVHFVITKCNVQIDSQVVFIFDQQFLVYFGCLFIMASQIVDCCQSEIIFYTFSNPVMILHEILFIVFFMSKMEDEPIGQTAIFTGLKTFPFGFIIMLKSIKTTSFISMDFSIVVLVASYQLIVYLDGFPVLSCMEIGIGEPFLLVWF